MEKKEDTKKKKMDNLDKYLIFCFTSLILYTIIHSYVFYKTGVEASVLTIAFYTLFGEEILLCFLIKKYKLQDIFKLLKGKDKKDNDDFYGGIGDD